MRRWVAEGGSEPGSGADTAPGPARLSYRALFEVPGVGRGVGSALLARTAAQMQAVVLVLFVLAHFHSASLAGLTVMMVSLPGLVVSPLAGALLDRVSRVPLMVLDYGIGGSALCALSVLALTHHLSRWALLLTVGTAALTTPLSNAGMRALFPTLVPRKLWDRANAVDSGGYVVAAIVGPGLAGLSVAVVGSTKGLLVPAGLLVGAAALLVGVRLPRTVRAGTHPHLVRDAGRAVGYVWRQPDLRMLAVMVSVFNLGWGMESVGVPVLVLHRLHGGSLTVGLLFAVMGLTGIVAALVTGRAGSEGRERRFLSLGSGISAVSMAGVAVLPTEPLVAMAMAVGGLATGPLDVGIFSLRQRVTDPEWFGRAFAVSMSLNSLGLPLGAALAGPVLTHSVTAAFLLAAGFALVATALPHAMSGGRHDARRAQPQVAGSVADPAVEGAAPR
jgi:MFS family permease